MQMWTQGITEFNRQEYYACHDTLEALWMDSIDPDKKFYQGVLQIAVACHHLQNHNFKGAAILLGEGMGRLRYYQPVYGGIDVSLLIQTSHNLLQAVQGIADKDGNSFDVEGGADLVKDMTLLPVIKMVD
jgi:uncharacterized protein